MRWQKRLAAGVAHGLRDCARARLLRFGKVLVWLESLRGKDLNLRPPGYESSRAPPRSNFALADRLVLVRVGIRIQRGPYMEIPVHSGGGR
jgi:hypothetical protein